MVRRRHRGRGAGRLRPGAPADGGPRADGRPPGGGPRLRPRPDRLAGGPAGPDDRLPSTRTPGATSTPAGRPTAPSPSPAPGSSAAARRSTPASGCAGSAADYDGWAALGNPGWSFADLLPYFRRAEADPLGGPLHGTDGPVPVFRVAEADLTRSTAPSSPPPRRSASLASPTSTAMPPSGRASAPHRRTSRLACG